MDKSPAEHQLETNLEISWILQDLIIASEQVAVTLPPHDQAQAMAPLKRARQKMASLSFLTDEQRRRLPER